MTPSLRLLLGAALVSAGACVPTPSSEAQVAPSPVPSAPSRSSSANEAEGELVPVGVLAGSGGETRGTVELHVRDDQVIEYRVRVDNPTRLTFTSAHLYKGSPGEGSEPVGTLFAGASFANLTIQVRGTVSESRNLTAESLAESLRGDPARFYVLVQPTVSATTTLTLRGQLRQGGR